MLANPYIGFSLRTAQLDAEILSRDFPSAYAVVRYEHAAVGFGYYAMIAKNVPKTGYQTLEIWFRGQRFSLSSDQPVTEKE